MEKPELNADLVQLEKELEPLSEHTKREEDQDQMEQISILSGNSFLSISRAMVDGKNSFGVAVLMPSSNGSPSL